VIIDTLKLLLSSGSDIYMQEDSENSNSIILRSIGSAVSVECTIPGKIKGSMRISAEKFSSMLSAMPNYDKVIFSGGKITLKSDNMSRTFVAMPASDFPEVTTSDQIWKSDVKIAELSALLTQASIFTTKATDYFTGYVSIEGGVVFASDRFSLFAAKTDVGIQTLIPSEHIRLIASLKSLDQSVEFSEHSTYTMISGERYKARLSKHYAGVTIPSYSGLLDKSGMVKNLDIKNEKDRIFTDFSEIKESANHCYSLFGSDEYAYTNIRSDGSKIEINAMSNSRGGDEFRSTHECSGPPFSIKANPRLISRAISSVRDVAYMAIDGINNLYFFNGRGRLCMAAPMLEKKVDDVRID